VHRGRRPAHDGPPQAFTKRVRAARGAHFRR
jgi:hypothetical protein